MSVTNPVTKTVLSADEMLKVKEHVPFVFLDGYVLVSKQDMKDIFGTLGDFDLERILEEAEECAPEAIAKYRKLEKILYE